MDCIVQKGTNPQGFPLRYEVFVKEQGFREEQDALDCEAFHVTLLEQGVAVATGRAYPVGDEIWHFGRIAVRKENRKQGLGAKVLTELEKVAKAHGARFGEISAQVSAKGFYRSLGYLEQGEPYPEEHVMHIYMKKEF